MANPLKYLNEYILGMNNTLFLQENQINNLYVLLLINRASPWDNLRYMVIECRNRTQEEKEEEINLLVMKKIKDVNGTLDMISALYQSKIRQTKFGEIHKLMNIFKARKKSIYIEKCGGGGG
jgi:hypothetical protein